MKNSNNNPRQEALDQCIEVLERGHFLKRSEDKFSARLSSGTIERAIELDFRINAFSKKKVKRMHPVVRNILRIGAYQYYYMDSVPDSAAINECVKLSKKNGQARASGFVNAVLRNMARAGGPEDIEDPAVAASMPGWIYEMWCRDYGKERTNEFIKTFLLPPEIHYRVNNNKTRYIQDKSSQKVCVIGGVKEGDRVLDVCAAPGGKAIHAADIVGENGSVFAADKSEDKVALINENIESVGFSNITAHVRDAEKYYKEDKEKYDVVLCDLPCSGLGVLRRKPEIKYRLKPEDITSLAGIQSGMLDVSQRYVRPGGRLIFSTCTITKEENVNNTESFLEAHGDFDMVSEEQIFPGDDGDGFYIAVFTRK